MLTLSSVSISFGQNLEKHQWKDRVLLVVSNDSTQRIQQILELRKDKEGLKDRKLIIYTVTPSWYVEGIDNLQWLKNNRFYSEVKKTQKKLEIILIGLDGRVKLRQTKLLKLEKLYTLIDGMPMRKAEIKKNK